MTGQTQLSVILCLASEGDDELDSVPPHLQELISSYQLSPFIAKVGSPLSFSVLAKPCLDCLLTS